MKKITVYPQKKTKELGDLYGIFFEDINHAADGGLYAELIQNRSFEYCDIDNKDYTHTTGWEKSGNIEWQVLSDRPLNDSQQYYLHIDAKGQGLVANRGFGNGICVKAGEKYDLSFYARGEGKLHIFLAKADGLIFAVSNTVIVDVKETDWKKYEYEFTAESKSDESVLTIFFNGAASIDLEYVSLFPQDTFMGRARGLRSDIANALKELEPKFMRFPGGCLTHDGSLCDKDRNSMYRWKRTIGPEEQRPTWRNNWGYNQTLGLGFFEYFQFCEDIGAKPLPVVPGGFNPHKGEGVPLDDIAGWVQETLDLIEFAIGDESTPMGKVRADMGHPDPFGLEYIGIGNEEIGEGFFERYPYFHKAIREKYPDIKIIGTAGPFAAGQGWQEGWDSARANEADLVDEHYYSSPEWFLANMHHYDDFDVNGPKVFLGEYASWGNTFYNALVEAAYMTHLEKAPAVALACYAPLLCNASYVNWKPDLIWYNNKEVVRTPNYYVQQLFMKNQGSHGIAYDTKELDEIIELGDATHLYGEIVIQGNDIQADISEIEVTGIKGRVYESGFFVDTDNREYMLCKTGKDEDYTLKFKLRRTSGRKGLKIYFGQKSRQTRFVWELGGWDNWDCNITELIDGRGSTISHRIFHVEDIDYELELRVQGMHIETYINGELWNDVHAPKACIEELYVAASKDEESGDVYVKAVNITGDDKLVAVEVPDGYTVACVTQIEAARLDAENDFGAENVKPKVKALDITDGAVNIMMKGHSVNAVRFSK